ncbi:MAG: transposase [Thermoplasmata archaeon]|nr:IS200/IS605 family element transposase accessory protein TnpB [Euryarchaeota archaeon]MVT35262.1 IS200/IS605 family element transposase accessory protein TnpB [Euryarchaeota archaeon]
MKVKRTEQIYIGKNDTISKLCHISKNLYNQTNYVLKQQFIKKEKLSSYEDLVRLFQTQPENDEENNYQKLPAQTAQWTIRKVREAWSSFFKALKEWKKHPEKFTEMPKPPKYKDKNGEFLLIFTNQQCKIEDGLLKFPKIVGLEVKTRLENVNLREVRIIPQGVGYIIEIVYMKEIEDIAKGEPRRIMGIDIGLRNIVTIGDSISNEGIAVKGGVLKSINQYYNKEKARLKSINDRQNKDKRLTKREKRLFMKRNRKIKDIMHKLSKAIVQYAKSRNIDTIVIGHNNGWKQSVNMGRINNQNFVEIPFNTLINQIKYKAEEAGIQVIIQNEEHTSKCSFLDNESIEHHDEYMGKRIKRGIFRSKDGILMHADLNAVYNIIKKAVPEALADGIEGIGLYPRSLSIPEFIRMITSKGVC